MRLWVWRHLRIELPDDWEMLQFTRRREAGRCAFADRYQFRLELDWRAADGRPDLARMMSDYAARLRLAGDMPETATTQVLGWLGFVGRQGDVLTSRFGQYLAGERCIVEAVFLWPQARAADLEERVLGSIAAEPSHGGLRRWRAFGMDLLATDGMELRDCAVQPACARMTFADARGRREEAFQRLGMVGEWLRGTVAAWLVQQAPRDLLRPVKGAAVEAAHEIALLDGTRRPGLIRRGRRYEAAAWICPHDGRLYSVALTAGEPGERLAGRRLSCCGALRAEPGQRAAQEQAR